VSQQIAPDPAMAAATFAATAPTQTDVSNRREIPVSSFDFLHGAYVSTRRARTATLLVLGLLVSFAAWTAFSTVMARVQTAELRSKQQQHEVRQADVIASLGEAIGSSVDVKVVLDRDIALSKALTQVAGSQIDLAALLSQLQGVPTGGATITEIAIGENAVAGRMSVAAGSKNPVYLAGIGKELRDLVSWAEAIRSAGVLRSFDYTRSPGSIGVFGYTTVEQPAPGTVEKIASLGVSVDSGVSTSGDLIVEPPTSERDTG
jgi:hypothetical protein